jgi:hypothetical protein
MTEAPLVASRLAGAVWGHLVGDAMGVPYEFRSREEVGEVRWGERGTHGRPPGTWSDDGALMLALLDSLLPDPWAEPPRSGGFDTADQARRALAWADEGAYTPDGEGRFDIGAATSQAMEAIRRGVPAEEAGPDHDRSQSNGSLMRILPVALTAVEPEVKLPELIERAHRASRVTHRHVTAEVVCAVYVVLARDLLRGDPTVGGRWIRPAGGCVSSMQGRGRRGSGIWRRWTSWRLGRTGRAGAVRSTRSGPPGTPSPVAAPTPIRSSVPSVTATTRTPRRPSPAVWPACTGAWRASPPSGWQGCAGRGS